MDSNIIGRLPAFLEGLSAGDIDRFRKHVDSATGRVHLGGCVAIRVVLM